MAERKGEESFYDGHQYHGSGENPVGVPGERIIEIPGLSANADPREVAKHPDVRPVLEKYENEGKHHRLVISPRTVKILVGLTAAAIGVAGVAAAPRIKRKIQEKHHSS